MAAAGPAPAPADRTCTLFGTCGGPSGSRCTATTTCGSADYCGPHAAGRGHTMRLHYGYAAAVDGAHTGFPGTRTKGDGDEGTDFDRACTATRVYTLTCRRRVSTVGVWGYRRPRARLTTRAAKSPRSIFQSLRRRMVESTVEHAFCTSFRSVRCM